MLKLIWFRDFSPNKSSVYSAVFLIENQLINRKLYKIDHTFMKSLPWILATKRYSHHHHHHHHRYKRLNSLTSIENLSKIYDKFWIVPAVLAVYTTISTTMKILRQKLPTIEEIDRLPIEELPQDSKDIQRLIHHLTRTFFLRRGLYVMTPFVLDDGRRIMVNRGWIPYKLQDPKERIFGQISDHIELNAYVVIPEAKKFSLLDFLFYSVLNRLDYGKIIEDSQIDIDAIFVADKASTTMMGPRGGQLQLFDDFYYIDRYKYSIILTIVSLLIYKIF
ncbi:hypothetical protein SSS_06843 [Sarcoptes scabiei]|nr:hypothetical protein SSS_06843 [Sarcoptes scabiei]